MDDEMLVQLTTLREQLRNTVTTESGRQAKICTDKALESLAMYQPRSLDEMKTLDNVSSEFVDKYGQQFLDVIEKYRVRNDVSMKSVKMTDRQVSVMKELEKNLVDINRRNRLLYSPKCSAKFVQSLYSRDYDIRDLIFGKIKSVVICDRTDGDSKKYTAYAGVLREAARDIREKGRNDLYIGYPFVKGKLQGEGFEIRAPLALIPVKADKNTDRISLKIDPDRDALFNNTLILAHQKHNNVRKPMSDPEFENFGEERTFVESILLYYVQQDIKIIHDDDTELIQFKEYKAGEFPKYKPGELHLENTAVLGKFSMQTSAIHTDYERMLDSGEINERINDLIDAYDVNAYDDSFYGDVDMQDKKRPDVLEKEIVYINELNGSQERVLKTIEDTDEMVIQGPPGTGKSQTIASLIVDSVNKGRTVMMVSEKKTALDVVYSRLGILSKYAIQIDDVGDKESFYKQMDAIVNIEGSEQQQNEMMAISAEIDGEIKRLEDVAKALYTPDGFGIEPYQLFHIAERIDPSDETQYQLYKQITNNMDITKIRYADLERAHMFFGNGSTVNDLCAYSSYVTKYPMLKYMDRRLNSFDLRTMDEDMTRISGDVDAWKKKFFLFRLFGKGAINKEVGGFVSRYLPSGDVPVITRSIIANGFGGVRDGIQVYDEFVRTDAIYASTDESERTYLSTLLNAREVCPEGSDANDLLFRQIIGWHVEDFRRNHSQVFATIDSFNDIVDRIKELTKRKKDLAIKYTDGLLMSALRTNILDTEKKGCKELRRKIDSKRKKSVNLFIKMFSAQMFGGVKIWLMTPEVVSEIIPFEKGRFDLVIFDEASQMFREKGLPAIYRAKKVVIAGDDKQLRPSSIGKGRFDTVLDEEEDDQDAAIEETSLLDLAKAKYTPVLLDYHYRSKYEELINFSNYAFYRARLHVSPNVSQPPEPPIRMHIVKGTWTDRSNRAEAKKVIELIREFFDRRKEKETLGVITFNINQRDLIERLIDEECSKDPKFATRYEKESNRKENGEDVGLFIRSIENVQGDERDEIIFSVAYAKDSDGRFRRNFGMLSQEGGENRLNVAITRAKKKVQIVTSMRPENFDVSGISSKGPVYLQKYLEYSYNISEGNTELAMQILLSFHDQIDQGSSVRFDSSFEEEVYDALRERGLEVDTQIGVGGYSIDLAVKKNGRYVLGIECDGKLYHSSETARERDFHRQKYLESRGWRIHRIWSPNWWNDRSKEVEKIVSVVGAL